MTGDPAVMDVPVDGGTLRVLRFGTGSRVAVAAHGITASAMAWPVVARALPRDWSLVAVDLRGRGHSSTVPGPFGMHRHGADLNQVARSLGVTPAVLVGHSMGAYAAIRAAAQQPELWHRLVLVDGGLPLSAPPNGDFDRILSLTLGPALDRLRRTFASEQAYVDYFREHPALGPFWSSDIEAYVRYDLTGDAGAFRSRVNEQAVREDGRDLLLDSTGCALALHEVPMPTSLLLAPAGMFGQPPGLLPEATVRQWKRELPELSVVMVEGTNHYTILMLPTAAAVVADHITG